MPQKPTSSPPAREYSKEIDARPLFSRLLSSEAARLHVLATTFHEQRDGRREPALTVKCLAEVLGCSGPKTKKQLDELASFGLVDPGPTGWTTVTKPVIGGREANKLKVSHRPPQLTKLDTRPFFTRDISAEASRLWTLATILSTEVAEVTGATLGSELGWKESAIDGYLRELAGFGLAKLTIGADGTAVHPLKLSSKTAGGLRFVEFTCEELRRVLNQRTLGSKQSAGIHAARKEECTRRAASRKSK